MIQFITAMFHLVFREYPWIQKSLTLQLKRENILSISRNNGKYSTWESQISLETLFTSFLALVYVTLSAERMTCIEFFPIPTP